MFSRTTKNFIPSNKIFFRKLSYNNNSNYIIQIENKIKRLETKNIKRFKLSPQKYEFRLKLALGVFFVGGCVDALTFNEKKRVWPYSCIGWSTFVMFFIL